MFMNIKCSFISKLYIHFIIKIILEFISNTKQIASYFVMWDRFSSNQVLISLDCKLGTIMCSHSKNVYAQWVHGSSLYLNNAVHKDSNQLDINYTKRSMVGVADSTNSVVSGNGTSSVVAFQTYRITVTAKDGAGNNIGQGGDKFNIGIFNQCTPNADFTWTKVTGAR